MKGSKSVTKEPIEPAGKVAHVEKLCGEGKHVAMAGDGINDALGAHWELVSPVA